MPTTVTGLLMTVATLLPGLVYVTVRERHSPSSDRSAFRETAAVVAVSTVAIAATLILFAAIRGAWPSGTPDIGELVADADAYFAAHYVSVIWWSLIILVVAASGAGGAAWLLREKLHPSTMSAWWYVFNHVKKGGPTHVGLFLDDGSWVEGTLGSFSTTAADTSDRELVLYEPLKFANTKKEDAEPYPAGFAIISAGRIVSLFATYEPITTQDDSTALTGAATSSATSASTELASGQAP